MEAACDGASDKTYALIGSTEHALASLALKGQTDIRTLIGQVILKEEKAPLVDEDMVHAALTFAQNVTGIAAGASIFSEVRLSGLPGDLHGTADALAFDTPRKVLQVHDLKFRAPVEAEQNEQLMLYANGAMSLAHELLGADYTEVELYIHQPHLGRVDEWRCAPLDLLTFAADVAKAVPVVQRYLCRGAEAVREDYASGAPALRPGEKQCKHCRAKAMCPALKAEVVDPVISAFADMSEEGLPAAIEERTTNMESARLAEAYSTCKLLAMYIASVEKETHRRLADGVAVPGLKLVAGRGGARYWTDERIAENRMKRQKLKKGDRYTLKLISPAQLEKKIGAERMAGYLGIVGKKDTAPQIVLESDKHPSLDVAQDFKNLEKGE